MRHFLALHVERPSNDIDLVLQTQNRVWRAGHRLLCPIECSSSEKTGAVFLQLLVPGTSAAYFTSAMAPFSVPRFSSGRLLGTESGLVNLLWIRCWLSLASSVHPFGFIATS